MNNTKLDISDNHSDTVCPQDQWVQYMNILLLLAKRFNPDATVWRKFDRCGICNSTSRLLSLRAIREHGIQHLKEYKLLPFI